MTLSEMMRAHPILRGALIAPSVAVLIFSFFNLTASVDQNAALQRLTLAVVNDDQGVPLPIGGLLRIADQALSSLQRQLPVGTEKFPDVATALDALDRGEVVAVLVFPPDFSRAVAEGITSTAQLINSDHLSVLESQVGRTLPGQLQAALSLVAVGARAQLAAQRIAVPAAGAPPAPPAPGTPVVPAVRVPPVAVTPLDPLLPPGAPVQAAGQAAAQSGPPVLVVASTLHAAANVRMLQAPFVMSFASWMGALIGSVLLFIGTRTPSREGHLGSVLIARTAIPVLASVLAALAGVLTVAWLTGVWVNFWELWAFRWLVSASAMMLITGLFSLFGFLAFAAAIPLVFYQSQVAGLLAPPTAAPEWIAWLGRLPFHETTQGLRELLIGGPEGSVPWARVGYLLLAALVLTLAGTVIWGRRTSGRSRR